jgi:hypothetical protein
MHLRYGSTFELAPVVQAEKFKPTHLRRQRSDLTDFRNRADSTLEELRRRDYGKLNLLRDRTYSDWMALQNPEDTTSGPRRVPERTL